MSFNADNKKVMHIYRDRKLSMANMNRPTIYCRYNGNRQLISKSSVLTMNMTARRPTEIVH